MNRPRHTIVFFALALASVSHAADGRLLRAIRAAEGVKDPAKVGAFGELGYFRIRSVVWQQHTTAAFARAAWDHALEERIAARHLDFLTRELTRSGQVPTPYRVALAWNAGLEGSSGKHTPASAYDYAKRVTNIYALEARVP